MSAPESLMSQLLATKSSVQPRQSQLSKKSKKPYSKSHQNQSKRSVTIVSHSQPKPPQPKQSKLEQMASKLQGSKFRVLNEDLYTTKSATQFKRFQRDPKLFDEYHQGFRRQVEQWPLNPLDHIIDQLQNLKKVVIADMGCGEARLAQTLTDKEVHSFDLVKGNKYITACNIANTPLQDQSVDIVVFCLALMGTDHAKFLKEAHRILRAAGTLKIAEVESRLPDVPGFIEWMQQQGFRLKVQQNVQMFVFLDFIKVGSWKSKQEIKLFEPCIYKRR